MMKWISLAIGLSILGFGVKKFYLEPQAAAKVFAESPAPPPPPPPPDEEAPPPTLDEEALDKIRLATRDTTPSVRWEAIRLLATYGLPEADRFLFEMLQRDTEADLRLRALGVLKERPGPKVSGAIISALKDSEPEVRLAALEALAGRDEINAAQHVSNLVSDSDERVRLSAIRTLNNLNEKRVQKAREAVGRNSQAQQQYQQKLLEYEAAQKKALEKKSQ